MLKKDVSNKPKINQEQKSVVMLLGSPGEYNLAASIMDNLIGTTKVTIVTQQNNSKLFFKYLDKYRGKIDIIYYGSNNDLDHKLLLKLTQFDIVLSGLNHERHKKIIAILKQANKDLFTVGLVDLTAPSEMRNLALTQNFYSSLLKCDRIIATNQETQLNIPKHLLQYQETGLSKICRSIGLTYKKLKHDPKKGYHIMSKDLEIAYLNKLGKLTINPACPEDLLRKYKNYLDSMCKIFQEQMPEIVYGTDPRLQYSAEKIKDTDKIILRRRLQIDSTEIVLSFVSQPIITNPLQTSALGMFLRAAVLLAEEGHSVRILLLPHPRETLTTKHENYMKDYPELSQNKKISTLMGDFSKVKLHALLESNFNAGNYKYLKLLEGLVLEVSSKQGLSIKADIFPSTLQGMAISDTVFTESSTSGIESHYAGIPTIFLIPDQEDYELDIIKSKAGFKAYSPQAILDLLHSFRQGIQPSPYLKLSNAQTFVQQLLNP